MMICFNTANHSKLLQSTGVTKHRTGPKHRSFHDLFMHISPHHSLTVSRYDSAKMY